MSSYLQEISFHERVSDNNEKGNNLYIRARNYGKSVWVEFGDSDHRSIFYFKDAESFRAFRETVEKIYQA